MIKLKRILLFAMILFLICPPVLIYGLYWYGLQQVLPENPFPTESYTFKKEIYEVIWIETGGRGPIEMTPIGLKTFIDFFSDAEDFDEYMSKLPPSTGITGIIARQLLQQNHKSKLQRHWHWYSTVASIWISRNLTGHEAISVFAEKSYFGHGIFGLSDASRKYFSKKPDNLNLQELSLLIGLTRSPGRYSPWCNPELALRRTNKLLEKIYIERNDFNNFKELKKLPPSLLPVPPGICR